MDRLSRLNDVVHYIEGNLKGEVALEELARIAGCSVYEFSRMFAFIADMPVSEYIRRRRLSQAVFDLQNGRDKIIDIALDYGYESPTAFTRAFKELHGTAPSTVRKSGVPLKIYPPIRFSLTIKGMEELNFRFEKRGTFKILGVTGFLKTDGTASEPASLWNAEFDDKSFVGPNVIKDIGDADLERTKNYPGMNYVEVNDTKTKFVIMHNGDDIAFPPFTAAISYETSDSKVKASVGMASDEVDTAQHTAQHTAEITSELMKKFEAVGMSAIVDKLKNHSNPSEAYETILAADWAVFTFNEKRKSSNLARAYTRILTEWFDNSGYVRRTDMPHLERFNLNNEGTRQKWEIWMPVGGSVN